MLQINILCTLSVATYSKVTITTGVQVPKIAENQAMTRVYVQFPGNACKMYS